MTDLTMTVTFYLGCWEHDNTSESGNSVVNAYCNGQVVGSLKWNPSGAIKHILVQQNYEGQELMRKTLAYYDKVPAGLDPAMFVNEGLFEKGSDLVG